MAQNISEHKAFSNIVAVSASMQSIFDAIKRVALFDTTVLITGESGTGKELVARAIHSNSKRKDRPFIALNCGAIPEQLIESELFGYRKGAFTDATKDKSGLFEEAEGGTIFLDEIGDLPLTLQVKILRTLQEQQIQRLGDTQATKINVRVITATLKDLDKAVADQTFRKDLFYRLNVLTIHLPPLRVRREDIAVLAQHFAELQKKKHQLKKLTISKAALDILIQHSWPGNIRELENCIERAAVFSEHGMIDTQHLPESILALARVTSSSPQQQKPRADSLSIKEHTKNIEIELISAALKETAGNKTKAAKLLEISQRALLYKLKEYQFITPERSQRTRKKK
jgi:two-component system, NtrC family, response regulator AtoC